MNTTPSRGWRACGLVIGALFRRRPECITDRHEVSARPARGSSPRRGEVWDATRLARMVSSRSPATARHVRRVDGVRNQDDIDDWIKPFYGEPGRS